jgi:glycosyltransferase involved in cell wall biosynthesis
MRKTNFKISIVVVSLNTKKDTVNTINSILLQSYKNYEILVIDGKSNDGTVEFLRKNSNKINFISKKDKGIYDAMNKGSHLASGEWIMFLNSGDIFYNNKVLSNIFKKTIEKKDIIYGDTLVKYKDINYFAFSSIFSNKTIFMPFCHQSAIVKTDIVKKNKFSLEYKCSSDFDFFLKCFSRKKIFYYSNLTIAAVLAKGLSDNSRQRVYSENIEILKKYNYSFFFTINLYLLKFFNLIKDCIKYTIPEYLVLLILKFKYRKQIKN